MFSGRAWQRSSNGSRRRIARCWRRGTGCRQRSTPGIATMRSSPPPMRHSCARSAICCLNRPPLRSTPPMSIRKSPSAQGRSWSSRSSTPASCSMPPMRAGAACTMRCTAPMRCPARPRPAAMTRRGGARSSLGPRRFWTRRCRWPMAAGRIGPAARPRSPIPGNGRATPATRCSSGTTACISRSSSTAATRSVATIPRVSPTSSSSPL